MGPTEHTVIWTLFVVVASAELFVRNRMVNRLRPKYPGIRSVDYLGYSAAQNFRLYDHEYHGDRSAMRLWYWAHALRWLTTAFFVLAFGSLCGL